MKKIVLKGLFYTFIVFLFVSYFFFIVNETSSKHEVKGSTIITETYFAESDGDACLLANTYATKMTKSGRTITIKIYTEATRGIIGVSVVTEEKMK